MATPKVVDEASTQRMLAAFDDARQDCQNAGSQVDGTAAGLRSHWSGVAANQYQNSINTWHQGRMKVMQGLELLGGGMAGYRSGTSSAEDHATSQAGSWAG